MPQPTGIAINNTHLLRAAMLFMVLGVIGPGLFQLKPPQWFGDAGGAGHLELAMPVTAPAGIPPQNETAPSGPANTLPLVVEPAVDSALEPAEPSSEIQNAPVTAAIPAPAPAGTVADTAADAAADAVADAVASAGDSAGDRQPSRRASSEVAGTAPEGDAPPPPTAETALAAAPTPAPPAQPERPAIVARKERPAASAATDAPAPAETMTASLAPRAAKLPAIPGPSPSPTPMVVSRDFTKQIPPSHVALPVKHQKESFIAITLPLILAANEEISQRRKAIERAVSRGDQATVERWARLYRIKVETQPLAEIERQLLLRADFVPVSLALAQAAIESGWGTSRFALQGNALFGQWAWQKDAGLKPTRASNSQAVVRSFPNLFGSVRAYMHNLNTHPRYAAFRARRHLLRGRTQADLGYQLSNFLDGYAEIGEAYVAKLKTLIRSNDFGQYEAAKLR